MRGRKLVFSLFTTETRTVLMHWRPHKFTHHLFKIKTKKRKIHDNNSCVTSWGKTFRKMVMTFELWHSRKEKKNRTNGLGWRRISSPSKTREFNRPRPPVRSGEGRRRGHGSQPEGQSRLGGRRVRIGGEEVRAPRGPSEDLSAWFCTLWLWVRGCDLFLNRVLV